MRFTLSCRPRRSRRHEQAADARLRNRRLFSAADLAAEESGLVHAAELIRAAQRPVILAGHGVVEAARAVGLTHIPGERRPYGPDDPRALRLLVGDNHIARLRLEDEGTLAALLQELQAEDPLGLLGTGYDDAALKALLEKYKSAGRSAPRP